MLKSIRRRTVAAYWAAVGIFLTTMAIAEAQGATSPASPPEHHHVKRYIALAIVVVALIIYFAMRGKGAKGAPPTAPEA